VTCVADAATLHPQQGYVTQHMAADVLNDGDVDVYLCGPPPMVDAVRQYFKDQGVLPASFNYEKFTPNAIVTGNAA
jgi:benzoate/toluate 1,2-dioxygenase reductase subunit